MQGRRFCRVCWVCGVRPRLAWGNRWWSSSVVRWPYTTPWVDTAMIRERGHTRTRPSRRTWRDSMITSSMTLSRPLADWDGQGELCPPPHYPTFSPPHSLLLSFLTIPHSLLLSFPYPSWGFLPFSPHCTVLQVFVYVSSVWIVMATPQEVWRQSAGGCAVVSNWCHLPGHVPQREAEHSIWPLRASRLDLGIFNLWAVSLKFIRFPPVTCTCNKCAWFLL